MSHTQTWQDLTRIALAGSGGAAGAAVFAMNSLTAVDAVAAHVTAWFTGTPQVYVFRDRTPKGEFVTTHDDQGRIGEGLITFGVRGVVSAATVALAARMLSR